MRDTRVVFNPKALFTPIVIYSVIVFLASFGDAIMSYIVPVEIEGHISNTFLMGTIISFSSLIGILCDFLFSKWFQKKEYSFFMILTFAFAILFPLSFILVPPIVVVFLFAMATWGIYYEFMQFSHSHFIHTFVTKEQHAQSWGFLESMIALAYFIGPIVAEHLIDLHEDAPHYGALGFFTAGAVGLFLFLRTHRKHHEEASMREKPKHRSFFDEFRIWGVLSKRIWPLYLFLFSLVLLDSAYWTVGTLISEQLRDTHAIGGFLLPLSSLPALFVGIFAGRLSRPFGKKRIAFLAGLLSGIPLASILVEQNVYYLVGAVFLSSLFQAIARPEIFATFEDYVARLGKTSNDLIGLQNSAQSAAYIVGPIISGYLGQQFGNIQSLGIVGAIFATTSIISLLVVPRKITMPQTEIFALNNISSS